MGVDRYMKEQNDYNEAMTGAEIILSILIFTLVITTGLLFLFIGY